VLEIKWPSKTKLHISKHPKQFSTSATKGAKKKKKKELEAGQSGN